MKLYVGNLNFSTNEESLHNLVSQFGEVEEVVIIQDRETGRSRGFGFVTFSNSDDANKAIEELHGTDFEGRSLVVNEARPKQPRPANQGGGGGGGGGYSNSRW